MWSQLLPCCTGSVTHIICKSLSYIHQYRSFAFSVITCTIVFILLHTFFLNDNLALTDRYHKVAVTITYLIDKIKESH